MSLRIWTAMIAVAGLALYTLSLLPETHSTPAQFPVPEESSASPEIPGTTVFPLIYRDPALIEFSPDGLELEPVPEPTNSQPEHERFDLCLQAYPIISAVSQEVMS